MGCQARQSLGIFDMDILDTELCQRVAYIDAMTSGVSVMPYAPGSKAAGEIENLCEEVTLLEANQQSKNDAPEPVAAAQGTYGDKPFWRDGYR